MPKKFMDMASEDSAKHKNRNLNRALAKLNTLFDESDAKVIDAEPDQCARNINNTVAIRVGLDNPHHLHAGADFPFYPFIIIP